MSVATTVIYTNSSRFTTETPKPQSTPNVFLFCLTLTLTLIILAGSIYSLVSLLKIKSKSTLCVLVTSLSVDDFLSVVPASIFMLKQWTNHPLSQPLCTAAAFIYLFQGVSSNLKASIMISYNFCTSAKLGEYKTEKMPLKMFWLLCSDSQEQLLYLNCKDIAKGYLTPSTPLGSNDSFMSPDNPASKTLKNFNENCVSSEAVCKRSLGDDQHGIHSLRGSRSMTVLYAQKRFSLILALTKVFLWLPIMIQMAVQHIVGFQSHSFETLSFLLTLLAATTTPLFVLSEHWSHLPCGCIINCKKSAYSMTSEDCQVKRRGFDFNLSFNKGYGIYKISQDNHETAENSISYHNLINYECDNTNDPSCDRILNSAVLDFSTIGLQDSSMMKDIGMLGNLNPETKSDQGKDKAIGRLLSEKIGVFKREDIRNFDKSVFYEGQERRLSHEESRKPELTDWEWCRSKSERTPRQRSGGALAIPLCAFQGTVSLHAPTGKTLSLSTYEVSSEGQKITPTSKKIEVYRSKSVGHEPSKEDSTTQFPDTNVKIHLEVLEICDNEEAMDTVSIISNISQSSTQARSPSLRYSRKENRFVSCDLGESASYSLFIPTNNPDSDMNISIPDTVEAHRQNSKRQYVERESYQEEIQLLNKIYRKREACEES
ncbi:probable G-protein coupled receptor 149 isoform X3 [Aquarana catesbeiana]|uniref:probable G-protein coupled receptor 149 isoform X3 n=1 Tax=Aquarana catesbeiana TaxID=8400 RepID=UPI003CC9A219